MSSAGHVKYHQPRRLAQEAGAPGGVAVTDSVQMITPQPLGSNARRGGPAAAPAVATPLGKGRAAWYLSSPADQPTKDEDFMATAAAASQFTGVDFLNFDTLLSEEERAVRDTVRTWVDENLIPVIGEAYVEGQVSQAADPGDGGAGALRRQPARGVRLRRPQQRGLRPHHAGAGAGRLRHPLVRLGAGRAGDVPDLRLRLRGAEEEVAPAARRRDRRSAASGSPSPTSAPTPAG